ncbi:MAG: hypothetical protein V3U60_11265 [Gammaproteobacteria bacterium]
MKCTEKAFIFGMSLVVVIAVVWIIANLVYAEPHIAYEPPCRYDYCPDFDLDRQEKP